MTDPVVNVSVNQTAATSEVQQLLNQELAIKRIAANTKFRQSRLKREING